ncbi:hypothetical protein GCM10010169_35660 [Micromonospora fulviviridis]|nr:hypothetical protein GCM10010169_35660 [Micromonospora fulviviridis]
MVRVRCFPPDWCPAIGLGLPTLITSRDGSASQAAAPGHGVTDGARMGWTGWPRSGRALA